MARVTYEKAIKCKRCGEILTKFNKYAHHINCQGCGNHIADFYYDTKELVANYMNADPVTIKVTRKWFKETYEEVNNG